ncbi:MAG: hypothetical protein JOZ88_02525 [Hyphomicrobiales bacterium]|nr:hypothetical protein [Hyphomicrobiales bacterium]
MTANCGNHGFPASSRRELGYHVQGRTQIILLKRLKAALLVIVIVAAALLLGNMLAKTGHSLFNEQPTPRWSGKG